MWRSEAWTILGELWDNATEDQRKALRIAQRDIEFVDLMPDDTVAVVRCGKCKHFGFAHDCNYHAADENGTPIFVREDDFCSYGERKDGEG